MIRVLGIIAALLLVAVVYLQRFMRDMALVESELISELKEIKAVLTRIHEKQL